MEIKVGGIYKHFKTGNLYKVIALAKNSETLDSVVVYEALYDNKESKIWVRPVSIFCEKIEWPKESGVFVDRFCLDS